MKAIPLETLTPLRLDPPVIRSLQLRLRDLSLRRAWPDRERRLTLEYRSADGEVVAATRFGQSSEEEAALHSTAEELQRRGGPGGVGVIPDLGLLVLQGGTDPRLRPLARLAAADGAEVLSHRAGRRAVVRRPTGQSVVYAKVVRRSRVKMQVRRAGAVAEAPIRTPHLLGVRLNEGLTAWSPLPGRALSETIGEDPALVGRRVGEMTRALHDFVPSADLPIHGAGDEAGVVEEWLHRLAAHLEIPGLWQHLADVVDGLGGATTDLAVVHRDLHDGQILVDDTGEAGLLDPDTLSLGEPALDLANLLIHLELGVLLRTWSAATAQSCADGILDGYAPAEATLRRIVPYAAASRLRLVCVYAFRPGPDPTEDLLGSLWSWPVASRASDPNGIAAAVGR